LRYRSPSEIVARSTRSLPLPDYHRDLQFGISVVPVAADAPKLLELAKLADRAGLDVVGIQDHPYVEKFIDTFALIAWILAGTSRITVFPDVANLPLRPVRMLAKHAASLDRLSGGRFELGLGAGAAYEKIAAMGGPRLTAPEAVDALEEAIPMLRSEAPSVQIWLGAYKPRMLRMVGRLADGWIPSHGYMKPDAVPDAAELVDDAAREAGRDPAELRRLYNLSETDPAALADYATELGFDTFVFWPKGDDEASEIERFAGEVVPAVREEVRRRREIQ
jgi:alkanesulfonate monooxygenase SsuD/methylene tetrahydromethanopterin reductase-like flavin-dependent oxidoreductase (luciferase family)